MARQEITLTKIHDHVARLGELYPPIPLSSIDRTVNNPDLVRTRYGHLLAYLARVELEVDRNVLELLTVLPDVEENDRFFYEDVWQPQEIQHGIILDQLAQDIGMLPAEPMLTINWKYKMLGALGRFRGIQDVSRLMYYLTGASTERQAVLAYNTFTEGLTEMGEQAMVDTVITPIKRQEPGHFAFYRMSAEYMVHTFRLKPWQLWLTRVLRSVSYNLVGTNGLPRYKQDMGSVMATLGVDADLEKYAKEIGRLEARVLWANREGMEFPPYFLEALRESVEMYREHGLGNVRTAV
ncbi:GTP-binding protein LepA [Enemella sp. A6]|uniref:GTP-binding protein LepA n=1 Tax=Enemella sp. A6 TaxID=3440152 RepID=UPI003EBD5778